MTPAALKKFALWTATDEAYKNALRAYAAKLAALKQFQSAPHGQRLHACQAGDANTLSRCMELATRSRGVEAADCGGERAVCDCAGDEEFCGRRWQYSSASVNELVVNRYTVNTEGKELRTGFSGYSDTVRV